MIHFKQRDYTFRSVLNRMLPTADCKCVAIYEGTHAFRNYPLTASNCNTVTLPKKCKARKKKCASLDPMRLYLNSPGLIF